MELSNFRELKYLSVEWKQVYQFGARKVAEAAKGSRDITCKLSKTPK